MAGLAACDDGNPNADFQKACNAAANGQGYLEYSTDGQTHCYAIVQGTGWKFLY